MFTVLFKLGWFFRQYKGRYLTAMILLILLNFIEVAPPALIGHLIDQMNQRTLTHATLWEIVLIYGGLIVVSYIFGFIWQYQLFGGANLLQRTYRTRLIRHFLAMTPTFYEKNRTGDLMARSTNDLIAVSETAGFGILTLIDSTTYSATILLSMAILVNWKLTLFSLLPMPIISFLMTKYGEKVHQRFVLAQNAFGKMNDKVLESIAGIRVLRAYVQERAQEDRFAKTAHDVYQKNVEVAKIDSLFEPTIKILVGMMYMIGIGYGAYLVFQSQITLGSLTSFNVYLGMLIWPMLAIGELINTMQRGNASLDRVTETLAYPADVKEAQHPITLQHPDVIRFEDVTFQYPLSNQPNLESLSLVIRKGETLGITGRIGSGKSTLIKQLLREYPSASRGSLTINDIAIDQIAFDTLYGWLGYVPQDAMLFSRTIEENVRFGQQNATNEQLFAALEMASLKNDLSLFPQGLETLVGERGISLSGGQKQRIALARALLKDPEILILDDAMSAVDAKTEAHIVEAIRGYRRGRTTLIATHRLSAVEHADMIIVMDQGRIVEQGTHEELLALSGWYAEQYARQQLEQAQEDDEVFVQEVIS